MGENYVVEVKNLNKTYGKKKVLDDVSLYVKPNEIVGFIGPNGAGKSTTMKCICNLIYPDSGEIKINGYDLFKNREKALESQAALIENPGLYQDMTGRENINMIAKLRNISKERVKEIYEFTEIGEALDRKVSGYSMGMKQRLGLGIAIMSKPRFIILDEPTSGLDPTGIIHLRNTIQKLIKEEDMSILFSSHQLGEVEKLADRIICINKGKIIETPKSLEQRYRYIFQVNDNDRAYKILTEEIKIGKAEKISTDTIKVELDNQEELDIILQEFIKVKIKILDIHKESIDVEAVYKEVYGDE
ncbi:ABC transporter ATP-binding protein [Tissierella pigra]|uniref:ABC transporter ATP-binding protein n=1 Tax=Tissierella pigra TaxID=2607614 RepID=A0A6N7Y2R1_9FIRM|nr:ABC transporter ATP-binding protein [Tissierella pigra]MSU02748.1 ABC transporter ATP-binding protein [Tissierella pigra]